MNTGANLSLPGRHESRYFPHIDGLRALAILPVILYHLRCRFCSGGFTGVDIFFVISGYLIIGGIIRQLKQGKFSFVDFYVRRIKRIIPVYLVVILFVIVVFLFECPLYIYKPIVQTAIYSILYSANIYFSSVVNYFTPDAWQNPLLHLWSLGVEEQFYIVVPLFLWGIWKAFQRSIVTGISGTLAASLIFSSFLVFSGNSTAAFFLLPSRAWELLAGGLISQIPETALKRGSSLVALQVSGLLLIFVPFVSYSDVIPFPGLWAVPTVAGACLLIRYGQSGFTGRIISSVPLAGTGIISYSLYLWHWPVFLALDAQRSPLRAVISLAIVAALAFLSWKYIEYPFRHSKWPRARHIFIGLALTNAVLILLCVSLGAMHSRNGSLHETWNDAPLWVKMDERRNPRASSCTLEELERKNSPVLIKIGDERSPSSFVLWGDSHALALLPGIDHYSSAYGRSGFFINLKQNFTLRQDIGFYPYDPARDREPVLRYLEKRHDIDTVILANRWFTRLKSDADVQDVAAVCRRLHAAGKHVFVFATPPGSWKRDLWLFDWGFPVANPVSLMDVHGYGRKASLQQELFDCLTQQGIATVIPINEAFLHGDHYLIGDDSGSYYVDDNHLNVNGSFLAAKYAAPLIWGVR